MKATASDSSLQNEPQIMGILNVNPDSFYDGGQYLEVEDALAQARKMLAEGARIIDVGGESTRPGARAVSVAEEWSRIGPVLQQFMPYVEQENSARLANGQAAVRVSVDTYKAEVARRSLQLGVHIINDVSGGCTEPEIMDVCAEFGACYVLMHNPFVLGKSTKRPLPHAKQQHIDYVFPLQEIATEMAELYQSAWLAGCRNIVLDPGLGFGKSIECNWQLLAGLSGFRQELEQKCQLANSRQSPAVPLLIGASNKRFVRYLEILAHEQEGEGIGDASTQGASVGERFLAANLAVCCAAISGGAQILRCHEVRVHYACMRTAWELRKRQFFMNKRES